MKKYSILFVLFALCVFASCGSKAESKSESEEQQEKMEARMKEIVFSPSDSTVTGNLGGCFEVVSKEYKATKSDYGYSLTVEIKRNSSELPVDLWGAELKSYGYSYGHFMSVGFGIDVYDENGGFITKKRATDCRSDDAVLLVKLESGETGTITFDFYLNAEDIEKMTDKCTFKISSSYDRIDKDDPEPVEPISSETSSSDDEADAEESSESEETSTSSTSSASVDKMLDAYESYVNKYISFAKRAAKGDMSVMTEYVSIMEEAQEYSEKLSDVEGTFTASQLARYTKITQKMLEAATEMQ